ncbi:hypothetical protein BD770DRAFT_383236 [Pilaira anomala]|nr:hypothetical protein BD770DRAFT_383236 [Pilaira anomala]
MAHNILRTTTTRTTKNAVCLTSRASYSNRATSWFTRFLSPSEEKKLYLGITSSFREKLVEQSTKSSKTYSHIIEHALLSAKPNNTVSKTGMLSLARIEQLKVDLDTAGKQKDIAKLQQYESEMDLANLNAVTMYNRLIRAYLWSDSLEHAEQVLQTLQNRGLIPTTRSFTYLIQAHLKKDQLPQAKSLVQQMKHLSVHKLRNEFDYIIMLKYYKAAGDSHAIDFLWRELILHADTNKPNNALYNLYLEHLLSKPQETKPILQLTQYYTTHGQQPLQLHHYQTWMKATKLLADLDTHKAEHLLIHIIKKAPPKAGWDKAKDAISSIITSYINKDKELKALTFYYRLGKMGVPKQAFEPHTLQLVQTALENVERQDDKATLAELEGLVIAP